MKSYLSDFHLEKLLLDSAMDAYQLYYYCFQQEITPFIVFKKTKANNDSYKHDFTIGKDGTSICKMGLCMSHDGHEKTKHRCKYQCPNANHGGCRFND